MQLLIPSRGGVRGGSLNIISLNDLPLLCQKPNSRHLEVPGLLPFLQTVFPVELPLPPVVVLLLVLQLRLVLQPHQFTSQLLQNLQLPALQVLSGLVVTDHQGVLHLFLGPLLVQLLEPDVCCH